MRRSGADAQCRAISEDLLLIASCLRATFLLTCLLGIGAGIAAGSELGALLDPRSPAFGATANDKSDDRVALQKWIDAGCKSPNKVLYLPPGDWRVTRRHDVGSSLQITHPTCKGLTLLGAGRASRIVMAGSAIAPGAVLGPGPWRVFDIQVGDVTIDGIAVDGSQRSNTTEQTHLVQILGPAAHIELRRMHLNLPELTPPDGTVFCIPDKLDPAYDKRMCSVGENLDPVKCKDLADRPHCSVSGEAYTVRGWFQGGDCIRTLGEAATPASGISIIDNHALECARSFVAFQRNSIGFTISGNVTRKVGDQVIDQEPSGSGGIGNVLVIGNRFERGGKAQGASSIALTGNTPESGIADSLLVSNNLLDGGIQTFNVARVTIEHNLIEGQRSDNAAPVVGIIEKTDSLRLVGNEITRPAGAASGPVVVVRAHGERRPSDVTIALNTLHQNTDAPVLQLQAASNVTISENSFRCNQPTALAHAAISGRSILFVRETGSVLPDLPQPLEGLIVAQNRVQGLCKSLLQAGSNRGVPVGAVSVVGNITKGTAFGVEFLGQDVPSVRPRVSDNLFQATDPLSYVKGPPGLVFDGSNGPGP